MELLAATYATSSSSEDERVASRDSDAHCGGGASPRETPVATPGRLPGDAGDSAVQEERTRSQVQEEIARRALAQRFAQRAARATHRATAEERKYIYKPYQPKRLTRSREDVSASSDVGIRGDAAASTGDAPLRAPLFSTLRAAVASLAHRSVPREVTKPRAADLPRVQRHVRFSGHGGAIHCLQWNPRYAPLFLSASMDHSVRVWSLPPDYYDSHDSPASESPPLCRRRLAHHENGVKSAKWSVDGRHVWSGGFDGLAAYVDVEKNTVVHRYKHAPHEPVTSVCVHPEDPHLALFGTNRGSIVQRDLRVDTSTVVTRYGTKTTGEIHDLLFLPTDGGDLRFVSSSALAARDTSHQTLLVWDFRSGAMVADHLNSDICAFTSMRLHPSGRTFVGQSTASEAVLFSAAAPYKRLKPKRSFVSSHDTEGFSIACSFNATGSLLATGDSNGRIVLYCGTTYRGLRQLQVYDANTPCLAAEFHPKWPSTLVASGYDGRIHLLDTQRTE